MILFPHRSSVHSTADFLGFNVLLPGNLYLKSEVLLGFKHKAVKVLTTAQNDCFLRAYKQHKSQTLANRVVQHHGINSLALNRCSLIH